MTLPTDEQLEHVYDELMHLTDHQFPQVDDTLPTTPAQYLFLRPDGETELWKLTPSGWFDAGGVHYDSPLKRSPKLTQWKRVEW